MLDSAINSVVNLGKAIAERPFATFAAFILVIATLIIYAKLDYIAKEQSPTEAMEAQRYYAGAAADKKINLELERLRNETGADRAVVRTFSNNEKDLSRSVHWRYVQTAYYVTAEDVVLNSSALEKKHLGQIAGLLDDMFGSPVSTPRCIVGHSDDPDLPQYYRQYLSENGVGSFAQCPLVSIAGTPQGWVGIGYVKGQTIGEMRMIEGLVRRRTSNIQIILQQLATDTAPAPWWKLV